ncbi:hypothetical protein JAB1_52050 [Janthinobacterium sp. MP5059B]|uniref:hypothetical protein n=1 Tax=Janthinobacterium sp. MP5059B TaxID=1766683 RepID=UPI0008757A63|nr:hypothetical protein [Janthinobacterium sp. MP5059B]OEZ46306.1 hypothetical protein JAB1_52050 [Janthinobacterium sp. MP5059B]
MTKCITSDKWRGERAEPVDPAAVRFKAREAEAVNCEGCLFEQSFGVCATAAALAMANGQPDCEKRAPGGMTYIYVLDQSDPRQIDLIRTIS